MEKLKFEKCFKDVTGGNSKLKKDEYLEKGKYPIIDQGKELIGGYTNNDANIVKCKLPCIIYGDHSRIVKYYEEPFAIGADGVKLLSTTEKLIPKYGYYYLQTVKLPEVGYDRSFKYLKRIEVPVPDLETQNKIVAILDKAKSILDKRNESISKYNELLRAKFLEMFGDAASNKKEFTKVPLKKFGNVITGNTPPRADKKNYDSNFIEWIKTDNIVTQSHILTPAKEHLSETGFKRARVVDENSLLVTCIAGSIGSIGRSAITDRRVAFNQQINAIVPNKDVSIFFLYWMFKVSAEYIQSFATGGMKRLLTKGEFEKIPFIKPEYAQQLEFEKIAKHYTSLKSKIELHRLKSENLLKSLSQQVFSEKITIDVDAELEALINAIDLERKDEENKIDTIVNDVTFIQRLIDRLNEKEFEDKYQYDKAKYILFRTMKEEEGLIKQVYKSEKVQLTLQNETA